jgi:histidyl-tRNA synthetase
VEKSGEEIVSQLFHFKDKGDRRVALRPELTPTLARMVASKANSLAKPIKWYNIGEHFRYERPQKGRGRSFYQFNADLLGETNLQADAELIALLVGIFETLGLGSNDFKIRLSDRTTWVLMLNNLGISDQERPAVLNIIDKSERRKPEQTLEDLEKIIGTRSEDTFTKIEAIKKIDSIDELKEKLSSCGEEGQKRANDWITLIEYLEGYAANNYVSIDLSIVRGLAYYTGFVYEAFEASGEGRALAGGGRYDHLVKKLSGNTDMPAAGFAIGDMTLSDCLESKGLLPNYIVSPDIYLICGPEDKRFGLTIISRCRKAGFSVSHSLKNAAFGKQFKEAGKSGARYGLILGKDELDKNEIKIKDFRSGNEKSVPQKSLIEQVEIFDEAGGIL